MYGYLLLELHQAQIGFCVCNLVTCGMVQLLLHNKGHTLVLASVPKIPAQKNYFSAICLLLHWSFLIYLCSQLNLNVSDGKGQFPEFIMSL